MICSLCINNCNILVLESNEVKNVESELYRKALKTLFKGHKLSFADITQFTLNKKYHCIVLVGDVLTEYFLSIVAKMTIKFKGPIYGIDVSSKVMYDVIPNLHLFEHIFVSNYPDYITIKSEIGEKATYIPSIISGLIHKNTTKEKNNKKTPNNGDSIEDNKFHLGLCLSKKTLSYNSNIRKHLYCIKKLISKISNNIQNEIVVHLYSFDYSTNEDQSDIPICLKLKSVFNALEIECEYYNFSLKKDWEDLFRSINSMDFIICTSCTGVTLASILEVPMFVIHDNGSKVISLTNDLLIKHKCSINLLEENVNKINTIVLNERIHSIYKYRLRNDLALYSMVSLVTE